MLFRSTAIKLSLAGFIVPFVFIYSPEIMLTNVVSWPFTLFALFTALIGVFGLSIATEGYLAAPVPFWGRLLAFAGALLLINPGFMSDAAGLALLGFVVLFNVKFQKSSEPAGS